MEIVDSESPGQTTHCSRFPSDPNETYLFSTVHLLTLLSVTFTVFPFSQERGHLLVLPYCGSRTYLRLSSRPKRV